MFLGRVNEYSNHKMGLKDNRPIPDILDNSAFFGAAAVGELGELDDCTSVVFVDFQLKGSLKVQTLV